MVQENEAAILELFREIGFLDSVICIGYFRAALGFYCVPKLSTKRESVFSITDGFHPAIEKPVANSFAQNRGMIITGSNASGKSTFLKMTAINALLAQTIHTCAAHSYSGGYYRIYSSMALRDNLDGGESYYIVEIKALKRIVDEAAKSGANRILCFVDEVLRGTNTVERIAASTQILEKLADNNVLCFAATHDIELTHLLENRYDNYHFEEDVRDGDVIFSYHLLEGRSQTRNAIKLLEIIGFSDDIINKANHMAKKFIESGEWANEL
jgi:DNA mismatch repair ATPase MutS